MAPFRENSGAIVPGIKEKKRNVIAWVSHDGKSDALGPQSWQSRQRCVYQQAGIQFLYQHRTGGGKGPRKCRAGAGYLQQCRRFRCRGRAGEKTVKIKKANK